MTATMTTTLEFPPTPEGVAGARTKLDELEALIGGELGFEAGDAGLEPIEPTVPEDAALAVFRSTGELSRTRELLKVLPGSKDEALTPTEIGELLTPTGDGSPLGPEGVRAVMRNEKRIEHTLKKRGVIPADREVVLQDWSESEYVGRYYLSAEDHEVIRGL